MYTTLDFKSKAALKRHLANPDAAEVRIAPNPYHEVPPNDPHYSGKVSLEGPHFPKSHSWWGVGYVVDGVLFKVV